MNKSPMVVSNLKTLRPELAARWGLDMEAGVRFAAIARDLPDLTAIWAEVFRRPPPAASQEAPDVDQDLYGGLVGNADRRRLLQLKAMSPEELALRQPGFDDERLGELVLRYRARNFPLTLRPDEAQAWEQHRAARLLRGAQGALDVDHYFAQIDTLSEGADERGEEILGALYDYAESIVPEA
jgi:exodeoxyribonuclease-1